MPQVERDCHDAPQNGTFYLRAQTFGLTLILLDGAKTVTIRERIRATDERGEGSGMGKIVVIGEILVEIMADSIGNGFKDAIAMTGPYPSGAPAIFIDQVARIGAECAIVSTVGDDDFGRLNIERLASDGVDISGIAIDQDRPTGSAFVRYRSDGSRDFVFNIRLSASGVLPESEAAQRVLDDATHLHVVGSSLSSPSFVEMNLKAARAVKQRGGTISFDPNLRKEILSSPGLAEAMKEFVTLTDVFLPSGAELTLLTSAQNDLDAVAELLALGVKVIVHKMGAEGVQYYDANTSKFIAPYIVDEVDPTGAGDCFGGAFVALWCAGTDISDALNVAAAAGAHAVTKRGPMEGAATYETLIEFMNSKERAV